MQTFINSADDMAWVTSRFKVPGVWGSAIIHGNEDAPDKVELFYAAEPEYNRAPDSILTQENWLHL